MAVVVEFTIGYNLRWLRHREPSALRVAQLQRETNGSRTCRELSSPTRWGERKGCGRGRKKGWSLCLCVSLSPPRLPLLSVFNKSAPLHFSVWTPSSCLCVSVLNNLVRFSKQILKLHEVMLQGAGSKLLFWKTLISTNQVMWCQ